MPGTASPVLRTRVRGDDPRIFWIQVLPDESGCWNWTGSRDGKGYGRVRGRGPLRNHDLRAHRVAYEMVNGPIPTGAEVCHRCDNPLCVRPDHLFAGTHRDNMRDMAAKGRQVFQRHPERAPSGTRNGSAKLTEADVRRIRAMGSEGVSISQMSRDFGMSRRAIGFILHPERGRGWTHVQ